MAVSTVLDIAVPQDVMAEVIRKNAKVEFNAFRDLVAERFADAVSYNLRLLDDPDEEDRRWVIFDVLAI